MVLRIYNSLTRSKQEFIPSGKEIKIYVCGVTVYDYCHLGHARAYVVWDMVRRYLQFRYQNTHTVKYIQNITDVDDKILKRAQTEGISMLAVAEKYIQAYNEDMAQLNVLPADFYPRATAYIPQMIQLIENLIERGYAYVSNGDVYYAVQKFPAYGKLSGRKLEEMQAGGSGRVEEVEQKRYPLDFALWKSAKPNEPAWESPWGKGRPGWHIECSAMVRSCLGDTIDIHAGGVDLQFPHHENEIAQSEAVTSQPLARFWMHNGFVNIDGEKMSKSLQNFKTIRSLLQIYEPMAIRLFILQSHYRQPIDFTEEAMHTATKAWHNLQGGLSFLNFYPEWQDLDMSALLDRSVLEKFTSAMDDDFNTAVAMSVLYGLAKTLQAEWNNRKHKGDTELPIERLQGMWATLRYLLEVLGFTTTVAMEQNGIGHIDPDVVEQMIAARRSARKAKNYKESDRIRDELKAMGVILVDQPDGSTRWFVE
ncbi:MAG: cysteine--tRNA ligase [Pseudanabaenaceae cyanobacterium]